MPDTDQVLIVYPREKEALLAMEKFDLHGLPFETIRPPQHLLDVASPAVRAARGRIHCRPAFELEALKRDLDAHAATANGEKESPS